MIRQIAIALTAVATIAMPAYANGGQALEPKSKTCIAYHGRILNTSLARTKNKAARLAAKQRFVKDVAKCPPERPAVTVDGPQIPIR